MMIFLFISCVSLGADLHEIDIENAQVELRETLEMRFCYISFVYINGQEYIIKQKKSNCVRKIGGVVRDTITAYVAENFAKAHYNTDDFKIAHQVRIIPAGKEFPGKLRIDWPATIHTIAPGKMIKAQEGAYRRMNIKQADVGFRRDMLSWMIKHPVLIMIIALDTFVCNHDRHRGNLFYDAKNNSFCAIDMDSAFRHNLCALGCKNFMQMLQDKNLRLSSKEIKALMTYKKYLDFLITRFHPEDILAQYNEFAQQAGFVSGSVLYTQRLALELENNRRVIRESYIDVQRLVIIVDKLIRKAQKGLKKHKSL